MRIRSRLSLTLLIAAGVGTLVLAAMVVAAHLQWTLGRSMARAQAISHEVSGLLVLTQEYALHGDARAAQQWLLREQAIVAELSAEAGAYRGHASFEQLMSVAKALPELFNRWQSVPDDGSTFALRRRDMLVDQILTSAQAMSDHAHHWYTEVEHERRRAEQLFMALALLMALVFATLLVSLGHLVRRRVLQPLRALEAAALAFGRGDAGVRLNRPEADELGELARSFDRMAAMVELRSTELSLSERQLRAVTDNLPALIAYLDRQQVFRLVNAPFERLFGPAADTFVGRPADEALGAAGWAPLRVACAAALDGERRACEWRLFDRGRSHVLDVELIPDRGADGSVAGVYLMASDVTARHQAEAERARSQHFLRLVADNMPALLSYVDRHERYRFANAEYRHRLGWDPDAMVGDRVADRMSPGAWADVQPHLRAALAGERRTFERLVDRGTAWLLTTYVPDLAPDGSVAGVFALSTDITALKQAEARAGALARQDALTGLPNRLQFDEKHREALLRAERAGTGLAVMVLDIDHFKRINDSLGHTAGDAVLREVAQRLLVSVRATDTVARLASDRFAVILEGLQGDGEPRLVARKILVRMAQPVEMSGDNLQLTASIGIAFRPAHAGPLLPAAHLAQADQALHRARRNGRGGFQLLHSTEAMA
jgi:diguanylate cyclase (GGDEF)-like protein/PAS domain S-box-containing protein